MGNEKKSDYRGFTPAQAEAHKRYMKNFVEIKVRMTAEKEEWFRNMPRRWERVQLHL